MLNIEALARYEAWPPVDDPEAVRLGELAPRPRTIAETGLSANFLQELVAKHLHDGGVMDAGELSARTALAGSIVEDVIGALRRDRYIEVRGPTEGAAALRYSLTDRGQAFALGALMREGYLGPAPVPLAQYGRVVRAQSVHQHRVTDASMRTAFADIVIRPELLDQLGAALHSGRPIFVYGPAGSGKSFICQRLARLLGRPVLVPHAVAVGDSAIPIYDRMVHRPVEDPQRLPGPRLAEGFDPRFMLCHRPAVVTGGELTLDMLEVRYEPSTRLYHAPLQLKATNGIYVIDDLGRQRVAPVDLFNRWIVPLEAGQDYLNLVSGRRFPVLFDVVLVFSTNLNPTELADEAFLRRIGHKIHFDFLAREEYTRIWRQVCKEREIDFDAALLAHVLTELYPSSRKPLLACHPRDLLGMALDHVRYRGGTQVTRESLRSAWQNYFVKVM